MTKYKTKQIDYTGCNPTIAEHLQRGEAILCNVWDNHDSPKRERWISSYDKDAHYPYEGRWLHAEPIPTVQRIMPPERAIPVLIAEGWKFDPRGDLWKGFPAGCATIPHELYHLMGKVNSEEYIFPDCIIEDVEESE